jgi:hypothetical protein
MAPTCRQKTTDQVQDFKSAANAATLLSAAPRKHEGIVAFQTVGKLFGTSLPTSREASAFTFLSDATINGCGIGVDSQYLGFIREYLAEFTPNLNVFDTLPIW